MNETEEEKEASKEKSVFFSIMGTALSYSGFIGVLHLLPETWREYAIIGYGSIIILMIVGGFFFYAASFTSNFVEEKLNELTKSRIKNKDLYFCNRILHPTKAMIHAASMAIIILLTGIIGGNLFDSSFFMTVMCIWSAIYFLSLERTNTLIYRNHNEEIRDFLHNKEKLGNSTNR